MLQVGDTYFLPDAGGGQRASGRNVGVAPSRGRFDMNGVKPIHTHAPPAASPAGPQPPAGTTAGAPALAAGVAQRGFVRCATYDAKQSPGAGYVFKRGRLGVGFYKDEAVGCYKEVHVAVPLGSLGLNPAAAAHGRGAATRGWHPGKHQQPFRPTLLMTEEQMLMGVARGDGRTWRYTPNHR